MAAYSMLRARMLTSVISRDSTPHREADQTLKAHQMKQAIGMFVAAALALGAVPALAADDAFLAGAKAYATADKSDARPSEASDYAYCAGYWDAWSTSISSGKLPAERLQPLPVALKPPSTELASMAMILMLEETPEIDQKIELAKAEALILIDASLAGRVEAAQDLFHSLGICQISEEE